MYSTRPGNRSTISTAIICFGLACGCGKTAVQNDPTSAASAATRDDNAQRLFQLGRKAAQSGDSIRAEQYLSLAIEAGLDQRKALPILLSVCLQGSRLRSALDHAEPYLLQHPEDVSLRYLVATIHLSLGQIDAARLNLEELLRSEPNNAEAHYLLGVLDMGSASAELAEHFRVYLTLAPRGKRAAEARGRLLEMQVRLEQVLSSPVSNSATDVKRPIHPAAGAGIDDPASGSATQQHDEDSWTNAQP